MRTIYVARTEGEIALAAAGTAKSIFGIKADAGHAIDLLHLAFSLDGITASEAPVLVELCAVTFATNAPGAASTPVAINRWAGPSVPETFAAAKNWTTEPTVITVLEELEYDPNKLLFIENYALESPDFAAAEGFVLRATIPSGGAAVNMRAKARFARA